jgi:hypothetical protein
MNVFFGNCLCHVRRDTTQGLRVNKLPALPSPMRRRIKSLTSLKSSSRTREESAVKLHDDAVLIDFESDRRRKCEFELSEDDDDNTYGSSFQGNSDVPTAVSGLVYKGKVPLRRPNNMALDLASRVDASPTSADNPPRTFKQPKVNDTAPIPDQLLRGHLFSRSSATVIPL